MHYLSTQKKNLSTKIKTLLYNALIRPHLEYAIIIWGFGKIKSLKSLQKRAIRLINNTNNYRAHTTKLFGINKILKLEDLRDLNIGKFGVKLQKKIQPQTLNEIFKIEPPTRILRRQFNQIRTLTKKPNNKSLFFQIPKIWSTINDEQEINLKKSLRTFINAFQKRILTNYSQEKDCKVKGCYSCRQPE